MNKIGKYFYSKYIYLNFLIMNFNMGLKQDFIFEILSIFVSRNDCYDEDDRQLYSIFDFDGCVLLVFVIVNLIV